jgi:preprotein translocase subunit SecE
MAKREDEPSYIEPANMGYFRATISELGRVVWPTRQELIRMTSVVVGTVLAISVFIALIDLVLGKGTNFLYGAS